MTTIKICVLGGHNSMQRLVNRENFEFYELYDPDPFNISIPQWGKEYTDFVNNIQPDFVVCINIRISTILCNQWIKTLKVPHARVIMWGLDSYRHAPVEHYNADQYFYCLDDDVKRENDIILPVYAQPRTVHPLSERKYHCGIISNRYGGFRDNEISKVARYLDFNQTVLREHYFETISQFRFGLNLAVHYDGLPNYRTFEYAACGVHQICSRRNQNLLDLLFDYGISYYDRIEDLPRIIAGIPDYDPLRIQRQVATRHTLVHRIKKMLSYFNVNLPLCEEDGKEWSYTDYLERHRRPSGAPVGIKNAGTSGSAPLAISTGGLSAPKRIDVTENINPSLSGQTIIRKDAASHSDTLLKGEKLFSEGKIIEAMECFIQIIRDTDSADCRSRAFNNVGVIAYSTNDIRKAEQMFRSALDIDRTNIDAIMNLSEIYILQERYNDARKLLEKAAGIYPGNELISGKLAQCKTARQTIVVDGIFFQLYQTGIARVWKSLFKQWANTPFARHLLILDRSGTAPRIEGLNYRRIDWYDYNATDADRAMLEHVCNEENAVLFISTYYTAPLATPSVFMAYDMIPEMAGWDLSYPMWREKHAGIRHACHYIAISQNTANDLQRFFPAIAAEQITLAHCGVDFNPSASLAIAAFTSRYQIEKPYWLLVGGRGGYKNSILFFQAFARMGDRRDHFAIVCTGPTGPLEPEYAGHIGNASVYMLNLSDEELQDAYSGAIALVYPSLYEGFGMPIIEAMACGCPVITSPSGSIPEVAGDAALFVNTTDVPGMQQALEQVQKPEVRHLLIEKGIRTSRLYSWEKMAGEVQSALLKAVAENSMF